MDLLRSLTLIVSGVKMNLTQTKTQCIIAIQNVFLLKIRQVV